MILPCNLVTRQQHILSFLCVPQIQHKFITNFASHIFNCRWRRSPRNSVEYKSLLHHSISFQHNAFHFQPPQYFVQVAYTTEADRPVVCLALNLPSNTLRVKWPRVASFPIKTSHSLLHKEVDFSQLFTILPTVKPCCLTSCSQWCMGGVGKRCEFRIRGIRASSHVPGSRHSEVFIILLSPLPADDTLK
jgi:hypothetical protein